MDMRNNYNSLLTFLLLLFFPSTESAMASGECVALADLPKMLEDNCLIVRTTATEWMLAEFLNQFHSQVQNKFYQVKLNAREVAQSKNVHFELSGSRDTSPSPNNLNGVPEWTKEIAVLRQRRRDRTCLLQSTISHSKLKAVYRGPLNMETFLDFINDQCYTDWTVDGQLNAEGRARQALLDNLFVHHPPSSTVDEPGHGHLKTLGDIVINHCESADIGLFFKSGHCDISNQKSGSLEDTDNNNNSAINCDDNGRGRSDAIGKSPDLYSESSGIPLDGRCTASRGISPQEKTLPRCEELGELPDWSEFYRNYLSRSKPFIIKAEASGVRDWPAFWKWTNTFLQNSQDKNQTVHIKIAPTEGEFEGVEPISWWNHSSEWSRVPNEVLRQLVVTDFVTVRPQGVSMTFAQFFDAISSGKRENQTDGPTNKKFSAYLEYSSLKESFKGLERDISEPSFLIREDDRQKRTTADGNGESRRVRRLKLKHTNVWLSDGDTLGKLHFDEFENFMAQIRGRKQFIVFDPTQASNLREGHIMEAKLKYDKRNGEWVREQMMESTSMTMSPVNIAHPDFQRFPGLENVRPLNCTVNEGDLLYLPAFWWHEVQSFPNVKERRNLAVNFWYLPFFTKEFPCAECLRDVNELYRSFLSDNKNGRY